MRTPLIVSIALHAGAASVLWVMQGAAPAQFAGEEPIVVGWVDARDANQSIPTKEVGGAHQRPSAKVRESELSTTRLRSPATGDCQCRENGAPFGHKLPTTRAAESRAPDPQVHPLEPLGMPATAREGNAQRLAWRAGAGDLPARPRPTALNTPPDYPESARERAEQGTVVLRVNVGADGWAHGIAVAHSSAFPDLDRAAIQAVRQWAFIPAVHAGVSVPGNTEVTLLFRLVDSG